MSSRASWTEAMACMTEVLSALATIWPAVTVSPFLTQTEETVMEAGMLTETASCSSR